MSAPLDAIVLGIHIVGATIWVGGTIALGITALALRGPPLDDPRAYSRAVTRVARQLSWVMWPALGVTVLTGIYNLSWYLPNGVSGLSNASAILLEKLWLVAFVILVSGLHTFVVSPILRHRLAGGATAPELRGLRRLNGVLAGLSLVGSVGILFLAAALQFY